MGGSTSSTVPNALVFKLPSLTLLTQTGTIFHIIIHLTTGTNALYQWSCSKLDSNNSYSLPGLEIFDDQDVADSTRSETLGIILRNEVNIFPLPPTLNCGGTVSAVRYCYVSDQLGSEELVFTLLTLEHSGQNFTIRNVINVTSTPTEDICTAEQSGTYQFCCDTSQLAAENQFHLPAPNFAFATIPRSEGMFDGNLIVFRSQYVVEHYSKSKNLVDATVGNTISVENRRDAPLRLLKFLISKSTIVLIS
jgi:hypothetical protein